MQVTGNLPQTISGARRAAFLALTAVENGAHSDAELTKRTQSLSTRDAALATQLVYGVLRFQKQLDFLIFQLVGSRKLDPEVRLAVRLAIFQLRYLNRIPSRAAIYESVELVKATCRSAAGFVNAILRRVTGEPAVWPDRATEFSCPEWLLARWSGHFGEQTVQQIAQAAMAEPGAFVRIPSDERVPSGAEPTDVAGAYRWSGAVPDGMRLQDISSQSIVPLLDLGPSNRYLDLCSAPGNKTMQALEAKPAFAIACDVSFRRLREVAAPCPRVVLDAREPLPFSTRFDRIFIDAPCSGTGTLARNPEIKWRLREDELPRFAERQLTILQRAAEVLETSGKLLYATCSLEREENEDVIAQFLRERPAFRLTKEQWRLPGRDEGDGFYAALLEGSPDAISS